VADWLTPTQRSYNMASIRSTKNRSTEEAFVRLLRDAHVTGWRRHRHLPGKPDFTFYSERTVVFIDGCFWHGCPACYRLPEDNRKYWAAKLQMNRRRDRRNTRTLGAQGWRVMRVWEHTLKTEQGRLRVLRRLLSLIGRDSRQS
jgi:DNA mismatch endonuclease, patch repair protein